MNAAAGLGGAVSGGKAVGGGYSTAHSGGHSATSVLVGDRAEKARRKEERRRIKEMKKLLKEQHRH